jgi:ABC-type hemin transport system ATPase subunit
VDAPLPPGCRASLRLVVNLNAALHSQLAAERAAAEVIGPDVAHHLVDPELLLLDEPSAGLDLTGRETLLRTLGTLATDPYAPASVLVTHHVEEIPVGITHALLLKRGRVVAAGPVGETLTAQRLGETFDLEVELTSRAGRWSARAL